MTDNQTDPISVFVNNLRKRFRFPTFHLKLSGGLNLLIIVLVVLGITYNIFSVYIQPDAG